MIYQTLFFYLLGFVKILSSASFLSSSVLLFSFKTESLLFLFNELFSSFFGENAAP